MPDRTILLADDHELVRAGLRSLIEAIDSWRVVAEAANGEEAVKRVIEHQPDILVLDLDMPKLPGLEVLPRVRQASPDTRVLVVSMHGTADVVMSALGTGAQGYLMKDAAAAELETALEAVHAGRRYIGASVSAAVVEHALNASAPAPPAPERLELRLTPRQVQVLRLVASGQSMKQVAHELGLSVKTVEAHRAQLMERLGIRDLPRLVLYALRHGLVSADVEPSSGKK